MWLYQNSTEINSYKYTARVYRGCTGAVLMEDRAVTMATASSAPCIRHVFLTGSPGVGKTTLIHKAIEQLQQSSLHLRGFYTEEVRAGGRRSGFDVITLSGRRGPLARVGQGRGPAVGQYTVDLASFESLALQELSTKDHGTSTSSILIIDEIGKMELFSQGFIQLVRRHLSQSTCPILGTIPVPKGKPLGLVEEVRSRKDVKVFMVTKENRNSLLPEIVQTVMEARTHIA
ncbi:cancer-related nucleoside-triphosphatase-like isoform X2 [Acanthaster planci]|uniref:Cancer-related nucleoside-triphosphatase-like isoform X2 n=1 Tax=Acanthaster planci TaxID=133434 RepID=A0A8B7Z3M5_ACAPL|nr:cancer-related nucleoside-triphosphatase-like isoform X2 [Acanthaster planci]